MTRRLTACAVLLTLVASLAACDLSALDTPAPADSATSSPLPSPIPSFVRPTPTPQPTFLAYVVRRGDTLSSIAARFSTTAQSLAYWNRATHPSLDPDSSRYDPNTIKVGWTLVLIPHDVVDPENLPPPSTSPAPATTPATTPAGGPSQSPGA